MLNTETIQSLIDSGEGYNVEFKFVFLQRFVNWQRKYVLSPMQTEDICLLE